MFAEKILQLTSLMIDMRMWPTAVIKIFTSVGCLWVLKGGERGLVVRALHL